MIGRIIALSIRYRVAVILAAIALGVGGAVAAYYTRSTRCRTSPRTR